jgi:hypothetical protein
MVDRRPARLSAVIASIGFIGLALFEFMLAVGAPLGRAAWGGTETHLAPALRAASGGTVVFYVLAALIVLSAGGFAIPRISRRMARVITSALAVVLALSAIANLGSASPWERYLMAPSAVILSVVCAFVARYAGAAEPSPVPAVRRSSSGAERLRRV